MRNDTTTTIVGTPTTDTPPTTDRPGAAPAPGVRRATTADADALSRTLADAFRDDPVFAWCMPDPHQRDRLLAPWFRVVVDALLTHRESYCVEGAAGAALWVPPGVAPLSEDQSDRVGAATAHIGGVTPGRLEALGSVMEARHPHDPHLYLWFAGVRTTDQGQGWGGRLLQTRLDAADEQGLPAYLEATSERNRALYERHGFQVTGELFADDSPPLWQMWRDPR
ncbi:GNAT family N-acetyltransferase [Nocardioides taihuensis]|uniref:GNAT family N-acetyltransferase n=1 Tax=Nocardioides taihuensis TaxID=1835606 RepID=A0ABW0BPX6_9ACTN